MNCTRCGALLEEKSRFCLTCGQPVEMSYASGAGYAPDSLSVTVKSSGKEVQITDSPVKVIGLELKQKVTGYKNMFKLKNILLSILIMAGGWLVSLAGQKFFAGRSEILEYVMKVIGFFTFARGGVSKNLWYMFGGSCGKAVVSSMMMMLIGGGIHYIKRGLGIFGKTLSALCEVYTMKLFLYGLGTGLFLYNFFTGRAAISLCMAGIAGALSMFWALGGGINFLRRMVVSLTADKENKIRFVNMRKARRVLSGMAFGFLLSVPLSLVPWAYLHYCLGVAVLAGAMVLSLTVKGGKEVAA